MEGARRSCLSRDLKHKEAHVSMDRGQEGTCGQRTSHRSMPRRSFFFHLFFFFLFVIIMVSFTRKSKRGDMHQQNSE